MVIFDNSQRIREENFSFFFFFKPTEIHPSEESEEEGIPAQRRGFLWIGKKLGR